MSGQITPDSTPRLVIPFGDRPMVGQGGHASAAMYQWMERINRGLTASITNITTAITQINVNTSEIATIEDALATINAELAQLQQLIDDLEGWIQSLLGQTPDPPSPTGFLPRDFIELESGSSPVKISGMPKFDVFTDTAIGSEPFPFVFGGANESISLGDLYVLMASWLDWVGASPLDGTLSHGPVEVLFQAGSGLAASNQNGSRVNLTGGTGDGTGTGGDIDLTAGGSGASSFTAGAINITSGASGGSSNSGQVLIQSAFATGSNGSGSIQILEGITDGNTGGFLLLPGAQPIGGSPQTINLHGGFGRSGTNNSGESISILGGDGDGTGDGGGVTISAGAAGAVGVSNGNALLFSATITGPSATGSASIFTGDNNGIGVSGDASIGTGNTTSATSGQAFLYTGDNSGGDTGAVNVGSGTSTGGTSGVITVVSGPGDATGNTFIQTGPASAGNSGDIAIQTGTATGTRGNIILDAPLVHNPDAFIIQSLNNFNAGTDDATGATNSATTSFYSGDTVNGTTGQALFFSGDSSAGATGDVLMGSGNAGGGNSGNITLAIGTATGTRGLLIITGLPTVAPATSGAIWRDPAAGNVLKQVP